jgi:hypothetical protein
MVKVILPALLLSFGTQDISAQSNAPNQDLPRFMGREITVVAPEREDGFPKGPASVCVEGPPRRQCYTAPVDGNLPFGNDPTVAVVQLRQDISAILFSAATGGVTGWIIHFSLLRPGEGNTLDDLFLADVSISSRGDHAFWSDAEISDAQIFVTAEYVLGPDESRYSEHRYIISAYVLQPSSQLDDRYYYLDDRYMTVRKYDSESGKADVLASEKKEILARLRRVKLSEPRQ